MPDADSLATLPLMPYRDIRAAPALLPLREQLYYATIDICRSLCLS